jgi:hypothetical protein
MGARSASSVPPSGVKDAELARLAGRQFNRISREQLIRLGLSHNAIDHRLARGRLVARGPGVFAVAPVLDDDWGRWMEATLTAPGTLLSHSHAAVAWAFWSYARGPVTVTRPGSGGPRLFGGVLVHRSTELEGDHSSVRDIPITSAPRTLLDLTGAASDAALARAVREAVRLECTTLHELGDSLGHYRGRRGVRRLAATIARYAGLPLERARSGAEIRAMELLRDAGRPLPGLNVRIAGEEADLSWPGSRLIVEIDGGPFHLDAGEDARKASAWNSARWEVRRVSSDDVYERPSALLTIAPTAERPK